MEVTLAAVFSAALMFGAQGDPRAAAPSPAPVRMAQAPGETCWGWYEECHICEGPTYEEICDTRCYWCPSTNEVTCAPTGWSCGGGGSQSSPAQALFSPRDAGGRRRSCS